MARIQIQSLPGQVPHYMISIHGQPVDHSPRAADMFATRTAMVLFDMWLFRIAQQPDILDHVMEV